MLDVFLYYMWMGLAVTSGGLGAILAVVGVYKMIESYRCLKQVNRHLESEKKLWMERCLKAEGRGL